MDTLIDFHSHILPGMDDGSTSAEMSVAMLRMELAQGIALVLLTPHFYPWKENPAAFLARRAEAEASLRREMEKQGQLPRIILGAEVAYFRGISESEAVRELAVTGAGCILIEMPPAPWPETAYAELEQIRHNWNIIPVIAHIDRYIRPFKTYGIPGRLAALPVLVQANASFFLNRRTSAMAMGMLKNDRIHLVGSDCHNLTDRKPNLGAAAERIRRKLGEKAIARICRHQRGVLEIYQSLPESLASGGIHAHE